MTPRRTRIKICGITRAQDALHAAACGADAIGLVFVPASPRFIAPERAAMIARRLPPFVDRVALFMDAEPQWVRQVVAAVRPTLLQFHGGEPAAFCESFGLPYLKAVPMGDGADPAQAAAAWPSAAALLLDGHGAGEQGGSGRSFDWSAVGELPLPWILAGGLRPDNVGRAIRTARPWGVDVSSGVESAPGRKDPQLVERFIDEVLRADADRAP